MTIDVGGTFIKYGLMDDTLIEKGKVRTPSGELIKEKILEIYYSFTLEIQGIAISSAGQVDSDRGEIIFAGPSIKNYSGENLKSYLESKLNICVSVINDVSAAALSHEREHGLFISIGTGIGGALVNDKKLYKGKHFSELEIGHMNIDGRSFEDLCSAKAICEKFSEVYRQEINGERINELYLSKEPKALLLLDEYFLNLGRGIVNILYVLDPQTIYFGGGISEADFFSLDKIKIAINNISLYNFEVDIYKSQQGNDASLYGAYNYFKSLYKKER